MPIPDHSSRSRKGRLTFGIVLFGLFLILVLVVLWHSEANRRLSSTSAESSYVKNTLGGGDGTGQERSKSLSKRKGSAPADVEPLEDTLEDRLRDPLDLNELSDAARTHYGLSDEDVSAILEVTHELREKTINAIHDGILETEDRQGAARAFIFRADPALRKAFEEELQERLAKLVNVEFAHNATSAFKWSPGFLKAGGMDLVFYINPDKPENRSTVESIRFEIWNSEARVRASHWEGSPERFARMYQLDFAEVLGVEGEDESGVQPIDRAPD